MEQHNCLFGIDSPCDGRNCGCDMEWAQLQDPKSTMDWAIELELDGRMKFYVFDAETFEEYVMCPAHFLRVWSLTEQELFRMIASRDRRVRLAPEE